MSEPRITNVKEFTAVEGQPGNMDELINTWLRVQPDVTIVDVKYHTTIQQGKLVKSALVLYNKQKSDSQKSVPKAEAKTPPTSDSDENPGARTMVMKIRREMYDEENQEK